MNILSWLAAVLILGTYLALAKNVRWLKAYLWTNLLGSGVLATMNIQHHIWQNFFLNIAYGLISVWGLWHGRLNHRDRARRPLRRSEISPPNGNLVSPPPPTASDGAKVGGVCGVMGAASADELSRRPTVVSPPFTSSAGVAELKPYDWDRAA
jgi:hypothetical protein